MVWLLIFRESGYFGNDFVGPRITWILYLVLDNVDIDIIR